MTIKTFCYSFPLLLFILSSCVSFKKIHTKDEILYTYNVEKKITDLGIQLPEPTIPKANYLPAVRTGNLIYLSGSGTKQVDGTIITGKVGKDLTITEGYAAARLTAINQLSVLKAMIGDLNKVVRIVKVVGMVNADSSFVDHPKVINGFSDLMFAVFGEKGRHARSAVGMSSLPMNIAVEIEMIVEVSDQ